jgi:hypothetical protein
MKKRFIKFLPYITAVLIGVGLYILAFLEGANKHHELLVNIAATFLSIPLLVIFYEAIREFSEKELNEEIFDYAKEQIDQQLLTILEQLKAIVLPDQHQDISIEAIDSFLSFSQKKIQERMERNNYLGFQIFKYWKISEDHLRDLLKNSFILDKMENDHIMIIIEILKSLKSFEKVQRKEDLYKDLRKKAKDYKIVKSSSEQAGNTNHSHHKVLLMKCSKGEKYTFADSGTIPHDSGAKCLNYYQVNKRSVDVYAEAVYSLLSAINSWLDKTGKEFILDATMIHLQKK